MSVNINRITRKINQAGKIYKNDLIGKTFIILYEGHSAEIMFGADNFKHLCGVESTMPAKDFYKKASKGLLSPSEISFTQKHPANLASLKTDHLSSALTMITRDAFIITDITAQTRIFKIGATDLDLLLCFDSKLNTNGNPVGNLFVPYSLRVENIPNPKFNNMFEMDYVLSKQTSAPVYDTLVYGKIDKLAEYIQTHALSISTSLV